MGLGGPRGGVGLGVGGDRGHGGGSGRRGTGPEGPENDVLHGRSRSTRGAERGKDRRTRGCRAREGQKHTRVSNRFVGAETRFLRAEQAIGVVNTHLRSGMVGDIFNQGTWKVTLKIYNLLQPPSIFLILSMDCRASPILSTLLTRTYLSINGVVL